MGTSGAHAVPAGADSTLFRKNSLDEMTVRRTEKPVGKPAPDPSFEEPDLIPRRGKIGTGSYEDPVEQKARSRRPRKTGRPGR